MQTDFILDELFLSYVNYDEHKINIGTTELISLYSALYRVILQENEQEIESILNFILEELVLSNTHMIQSHSQHSSGTKYNIVFTFLSLYQHLLLHIIASPFHQYTHILYQAIKHSNVNQIQLAQNH